MSTDVLMRRNKSRIHLFQRFAFWNINALLLFKPAD
jgi:hypothetical protein